MTAAAPRCSAWAREVGLRPQGSAPTADRWLLVDWPLPWPRDAADVEGLAPVREALAADGVRTRLQLVVPRPDATERRIVLHERPPDDGGWFAGYRRRHLEVDPDDLVDACRSLLAGDGSTDADAVDVLICSHGTRDRCCGSSGTALAIEATALGATVLRTSHLGGHRFAPTAAVLPHGTCWAFLDGESLAEVLTRTGDAGALARERYRGCTAFASPAAQAADAAALAEAGWRWLDGRRRVAERVLDPEVDGSVHLTLENEVGDRFEVEVREGRRMPVPDCGQPVEAAKKSEPEQEVVAVRRA